MAKKIVCLVEITRRDVSLLRDGKVSRLLKGKQMNTIVSSKSPGIPRAKTPSWFWAAAVAGLAWNAYGAQQFFGSLLATPESMMAMGMTIEQASLYSSLPVWMTAAFATGVFGGLAGCTLLLLRKRLATPVFLISLLGYLVLYAGDITEGVFAALGAAQVAILTTVVLIAAGLLWVSRYCDKNGQLV
jgi:hypothetical protein